MDVAVAFAVHFAFLELAAYCFASSGTILFVVPAEGKAFVPFGRVFVVKAVLVEAATSKASVTFLLIVRGDVFGGTSLGSVNLADQH